MASRRPDGSLRASWKFSGPRPKATEDAAEELEFEHGDKGLNNFFRKEKLITINEGVFGTLFFLNYFLFEI